MTRAPVDCLAIHLLISSEMMEPAKPMMAEKISSWDRSRPLAVRKRPTPRIFMDALRTIRTATLVIRNRKIRFMFCIFQSRRALEDGLFAWLDYIYWGRCPCFKALPDIFPAQEYSLGFWFLF